MSRIRPAVFAAAVAGSMLVGGAVGAAIYSASTVVANAATASPSPAASPGTFKSNEDATHEQGESAAQEAAENNGTAPHGGPGGPRAGGSNEDPTHEAGESAAREAQENQHAPASPAPSGQ